MVSRGTAKAVWAISAAMLSAVAIANLRAADNSAAQPAEPAAIQVVTYASGLTGFFDPGAQRLYLYATDVKTLFMTVEIEQLGKPLKVVNAPQ